jgi:hypothetical protein
MQHSQPRSPRAVLPQPLIQRAEFSQGGVVLIRQSCAAALPSVGFCRA